MLLLKDNHNLESNDVFDQNIYVFSNYDEFLSYFNSNLNNDIVVDDDIFNLAILDIQDDGTIIASCYWCRKIISSLNNECSYVKKLGKK